MSAATRAKTARERANIAARFIRDRAPYGGPVQSRAFDDCFEMGDGEQVIALLKVKARTSPTIDRYLADFLVGYRTEPLMTFEVSP